MIVAVAGALALGTTASALAKTTGRRVPRAGTASLLDRRI